MECIFLDQPISSTGLFYPAVIEMQVAFFGQSYKGGSPVRNVPRKQSPRASPARPPPAPSTHRPSARQQGCRTPKREQPQPQQAAAASRPRCQNPWARQPFAPGPWLTLRQSLWAQMGSGFLPDIATWQLECEHKSSLMFATPQLC